MMKDFTSPFDMGFQIMLSTLHKNFPGPQKALVCSKNYNNHWCKILDAMSKYVSSLHIDNILLAGEILKRNKLLTQYSHKMLDNSIAIELLLSDYGLPVIRRTSCEKPHTHHLWIKMDTKDDAFNFYKKMETCNLLVNYRKLPYRLGQGIRMGTSAATLQGVNHDNVSKLAEFIHIIYSTKIISKSIVEQVQDYILSLSPLPYEGSLTELQ